MRHIHAVDTAPDSAEQAARVPESGRAGRSSSVLAAGRERVARLFDDLIERRIERRDYSASNEAIARKLGVNEKQIREYRNGEKNLPAGAILMLPGSLADEFVARLAEELRRQRIARAAEGTDRQVELSHAADGRFSISLADANADGTRTVEEIDDLIDAARAKAEHGKRLIESLHEERAAVLGRSERALKGEP